MSMADFKPETLVLITRRGYKMENKLGEGGFGVVYKAIRAGKFYAVKVINLKKMDGAGRTVFLPREIKTLIACRHENLIHVFEIFRADNKIFIFMEYAANGDITGYMVKKQGVKEKLACQWFYQASTGLYHLHQKLLTAHRDIKLDNILLDGNWIAKLTDFGFAKKCYDVSSKRLILSETICGTVPYECPQIIEKQAYNAFKADIWSMGVSLYIMLHSCFPFHFKDSKLMLAEMKNYPGHLRSHYVKKLPDDANYLMEELLHPNEGKRGSVYSILRNSYLKQMQHR